MQRVTQSRIRTIRISHGTQRARGGLIALLVLWLTLGLSAPQPAVAAPLPQTNLCGNGSAPDYGFTYDLLQEHWTVNWRSYVSEQSVTEVDAILDRLNADSIAQTMILFLPADQVGLRVNCAVHFLRYMRLGLPAGERKDNGFVFLIVVEPDAIDVHYAVGLGLPALTAPELTAINRDAEAAYKSTGSLDQALLTMVREFDAVSRNKYAPLVSATATPTEDVYAPLAPAGPASLAIFCTLVCLGILLLLFLLWAASRLARAGIEIEPYRGDSFGGPWIGGGGRWGGGSWGGGGWGGGGGWSGGRGGGGSMRGGSGGGRSGRGN